MIVRLSIKNYKDIRAIDKLELGKFQVLPKSEEDLHITLFDSLLFVSDCLRDGPEQAVKKRVNSYREITYKKQGGKIEFDLRLGLEIDPYGFQKKQLRYFLSINEDQTRGVRVDQEFLYYLPNDAPDISPVLLLEKKRDGSDFFRSESGKGRESWPVDYGFKRCALTMVPPDWNHYPTANAANLFLLNGIKHLKPDPQAIRKAEASSTSLLPDGGNLIQVIGRLPGNRSYKLLPKSIINIFSLKVYYGQDVVSAWTESLKKVLPDLKRVVWKKRGLESLFFEFKGEEVPCLSLSDRTLELLFFSLLPFLPPAARLYLIEEPETGFDSQFVAYILESLLNIPKAQTLIFIRSAPVNIPEQTARSAI